MAERVGLECRKPHEPEKLYSGHGQHPRERSKRYTFLNQDSKRLTDHTDPFEGPEAATIVEK